MTREQLVSEIETAKAFSETWIGKHVYQTYDVDMCSICTELLCQYISDKNQISKTELELFDALYPGFSTAILHKCLNRDAVKEEYLKELYSCRRRIAEIDDRMFYSYDVTTGSVQCLEIIARGFNGDKKMCEDDNRDDVLNADYNFFKWWLFRMVSKYGPLPNSQNTKSVFYIDATEWERIKEKFPKMVKRLITGTSDIRTNAKYFSNKERAEELELLIAKIESDENDAVYIYRDDYRKDEKNIYRVYRNYIKCTD